MLYVLTDNFVEADHLPLCGREAFHADSKPKLQWDNLMAQAASSVDVLGNPENVKIMSNILKTNVSACTSIGSFFLPQLGRIWLDMLGLYKAVSGIISEQVATQG